MSSRVILFDLDGTLVDSSRDLAGALNQALEETGQTTHSVDAVRRMVGHGAGHLVRSALSDEALFDETRARFFEHYQRRVSLETAPYPGIEAMLDRLCSDGAELLVATNKPALFTRPLLEALDLQRFIRAYACGDEGGRKPDPGALELALSRADLEIEPGDTVYVGDMPVDRETAQNFGCPFVGVSWGFGASALASLGETLTKDADALYARLIR